MFVFTKAVVRNPTADLSAMPDELQFRESVTSAGFGVVNLNPLVLPQNFRVMHSTDTGRTVAAGGKIQAKPLDVLGSAATVTVDVFGYFLP